MRGMQGACSEPGRHVRPRGIPADALDALPVRLSSRSFSMSGAACSRRSVAAEASLHADRACASVGAQTSHRPCVITTVGFLAAKAFASMPYRGLPAANVPFTISSMSTWLSVSGLIHEDVARTAAPLSSNFVKVAGSGAMSQQCVTQTR